MSKSTPKSSSVSRQSDQAWHLPLKPALAKLWAPKRHLLDTTDLTKDEAQCILELAAEFKTLMENKAPYPVLNQKTIANVFYENSTRTRSSFELAARRLGADVINLDVSSSSVVKGETMRDTARTLVSMGVNAIVLRHPASGSAHLVAKLLGESVSVVNAGDGWHAHPTQALLDLFTMNQERDDLRGCKVVIVGDILHSRVARSNIFLLKKFDVDVHVVDHQL